VAAALSKPALWARLQQVLAYLIAQLGGDAGVGDALAHDDFDEGDAAVTGRDSWKEGGGDDLPDVNEEGISAAVRTARQKQLLAALQSAAVTMMDPLVHARITVAAIMMRQLKDVNMSLQHATPDPSTIVVLRSVYATLGDLLNDDMRPQLLVAGVTPLKAALGAQPATLTLTAVVTSNEDDGTLSVAFPSLQPAYTRIAPIAPVAAVKAKPASVGLPAVKAIPAVKAQTAEEHMTAIWEDLLSVARVATERAVGTFNKRVAPVINCAERRHAASLYNLDNVSLDATDFHGLLNDSSGALPFVPEGEELPRWPWSWNERAPPVAAGDGGGGGGAAAAAADDDDDDDSHLDAGLLATLQVEWSRFKAFATKGVIGEPRTVTAEDKKLPARYWIRTRPFWRDLSELMLLWLTTPISTACVERGFSFMTMMMDSNTRRRRMKEAGFRADFMAHLHREWLRSALCVAAK
jgi:hypothetical protein